VEWLATLGSDGVARLLDAAPDPTLVIDAEGRIQVVSEQVTFVLGHSRHELEGRNVRDLVPEWDVTEAGDLSAYRPSAVGVARHRDGRAVPVEISVTSIGAEAGAGGLVGVFLRDISARLQIEHEADRMRDELITNITHELQTPLTSINGYLELLSELGDDELGPEARRLVEIVHRNAKRELRLVDDLLTVTFIDENLARMANDLVDLSLVAHEVAEERRAFADGAGITLTLETEVGATVRGDAHHLARLVSNLVTNSCKFSPPGAEIRISVSTDDTGVTVTVADTGIGVSEAESERLFERMYRAPGAIDRQVEGAGLGLAIVKAIAEAHSGTISLESTLGVGTTVRVTLPRVRAF
jgi:two-component system, OmpR family, phosphate regulon sensor histidine kinase PhoR